MPPRPRVVLANAFSLSMLSATETTLRVREITADEVKKLLSSSDFESAIGHESTASYLSRLLGVEVRAERKQVTLTPNVILIVFQLIGRLPEGRILTEEELQTINYRFYTVEVLA